MNLLFKNKGTYFYHSNKVKRRQSNLKEKLTGVSLSSTESLSCSSFKHTGGSLFQGGNEKRFSARIIVVSRRLQRPPIKN